MSGIVGVDDSDQRDGRPAARARPSCRGGGRRLATVGAAVPVRSSHSPRMRRLVALSSTTSTRIAGTRSRGRGGRRGSASAGTSNRAVKWKVLPWPGLALDPDPAAHQLDQLAGDGQAQPGAAVLARRRAVRLGERLEDRLAACPAGCRCRCRGPRSAGAASRDRNRSRTSSARPLHDRTTTSPALGELDGVADQVDQHLPQPARVADQAVGHVGADVAGQLQPLGVGAHGQRLERVAERVAQGESAPGRGRACRPRSWRSRGCR